MAESKLIEGQATRTKLVRSGSSLYFLVPPVMREYLAMKDGEEWVVWKADKGKHGPFIGFGRDKNQ